MNKTQSCQAILSHDWLFRGLSLWSRAHLDGSTGEGGTLAHVAVGVVDELSDCVREDLLIVTDAHVVTLRVGSLTQELVHVHHSSRSHGDTCCLFELVVVQLLDEL